MNSNKSNAHFTAATELVELMSIAGWLALLADLFWVVRDYVVNNCPISLIPVMVLLLTGFILMSVGIVKYHFRQYKKLLHDNLLKQLDICKRKNKCKKS